MSNSTTSVVSSSTSTSSPVDISSFSSTTPSSSTTSSIVSSSSTTSSSSSSFIPASTTTTSASTAPGTTVFHTSTITQSPLSSAEGPTTVFETATTTPTEVVSQSSSSTTSSASSSSSTAANYQDSSKGSGNSGGLGTAGKTAIAVVIPVVVVALLVFGGIFLWRRRKQKKEANEARRAEIQDYGYNPNHDPTLPNVMQEHGSEMAEDTSGYRGWGAAGAAAAMSNRKTSTTLTHAQMSDTDSNLGYGAGPRSPGLAGSDSHSGDGLMNNRRETMGSDDLGALGVAPVAASQPIRRGPSNASSAYSAGARSDHSDEQPPMPGHGYGSYDYNPASQYNYTQHGPYGDGSYGGGQDAGMPIVRDVSARRNTRIQQGGTYQQGNSGIAQNF